MQLPPVGIDLPELIRLKRIPSWRTPKIDSVGRDWSAWIDTIETSHYLKRMTKEYNSRDWSAWIDTIETAE